MVPAPSGETPGKAPMVEVEAVEAVDVAEQVSTTVALEEAVSEGGSEGDDSDDDALSDDACVIQFVPVDQLQNGEFYLICYRVGVSCLLTPDIPAIWNPPLNAKY